MFPPANEGRHLSTKRPCTSGGMVSPRPAPVTRAVTLSAGTLCSGAARQLMGGSMSSFTAASAFAANSPGSPLMELVQAAPDLQARCTSENGSSFRWTT